ncbi:MAG: fumarylacetoacetate hydrolase [Burkholderiaceae bacterium]
MPKALPLGALLAACALAASSPALSADCAPDAVVDRVARSLIDGAKLPPDLGVTDLDAATCGREKIVAILGRSLGEPVGYKAAVTSDGVKKLFGFDEPVLGILLKDMLHPSGGTLPADTSSVFEGDLILEVGSEAINEATTPIEVLRHTRAIYPFMEVARAIIDAPPPKIGLANFTLANAFAYRGVIGAPIILPADQASVDMLADMQVSLLDENGTVLHSAPGKAILGQPLNAAIWIAGKLQREGRRLRSGDLLSLGSITRLLPVKAGLTARARYEGLPGSPEIEVTFK